MAKLIGRVRLSVRDVHGTITHYVAYSGKSTKPTSHVNIVNMTPGHIMLDTGCRRSVVGPAWHRHMQERLRQLDLHPQREPCTAQFVFGSGRSVKATCRWIYPIAIRGHPALIDVAEVPCDCLGLMSRRR